MATSQIDWTKKCMIGTEWYYCPISIMTFVVFFILFIYSVFVCIRNWSEIMKYTEEIDKQQLKRLESLYLVNLISAFISFAVVVFFITRAMETSHFLAIFNKYLALIIIVFLIVVSSWNINVYSNLKDGQRHTTMQTINGIVLGISCLLVVVAIGLLIKQHYSSPSSP